MKMTREKKIDLLYNHYKDTFENIKVFLNRRNLYTFIILGLILLLSFQVINPVQTIDLSNELIKKNIGDVKIDYRYIDNIIIFALFWITLLYFQISLLIDRYYEYIQKIEKDLSEELDPYEISREGKSYLNEYPWLSTFAHWIYTVLFPVILLLIVIIKWTNDKMQLSNPWAKGHFLFETIIILGIIISTVLYAIRKHFDDFKSAEKIKHKK
jgi:hypothetical protein